MIFDEWFNEEQPVQWGIKPNWLRGIGKVPCNYTISDRQGNAVYIGETNNLFRRMKEHRLNFRDGHTVKFYNLGCDSIEERETIEYNMHLIHKSEHLLSNAGRRTSGGKVAGEKHWLRKQGGWTDEQKLALKNRPVTSAGTDNGMYGTLPWNHPKTKMNPVQVELWSRMPELYELWLSLGKPKNKTFAKSAGAGNYLKMVELFSNDEKYSRILEEWKNVTFA